LPIRLGFESTLLLGWECVGSALLSLPIGMLAVLGWVRQGERRPLRYAIPLGCMIVLIGIAAPATSWSRPFATELSAALLGVMIGVGAATATSWRSMPLQSLSGARRLRPWLLLSTAVWIFVIVAQAWHSSSYQLSSVLPRDGGPWLSGAPFDSYDLYSASPIQALHESILEFLMAFPLGFLLRLSWPLGVGRLRRTQGIILAAVVVLVLAGVELGQSAPPMRSADAMDMLVAMSGGIVGLLSGVPFLRRQRTA
jgi:hypothetical protein